MKGINLGLLVAAFFAGTTIAQAQNAQYMPILSYRVGPYGGVMTLAADDATGAVAPVVIRIRHP